MPEKLSSAPAAARDPLQPGPAGAMAWWLRGGLLLQTLGISLWLWLVWPRSPLWASLGVVLWLLGYSLILVLELLVLRRLNRDGTPTVRALLRACWAETLWAARVFGWQQAFFSRRLPDQDLGNPPCATNAPGSAAGRRGVVLIHGFACNRGFWAAWLRHLQADGRAYVAVNLEPVFGSIDDYAPLIDEAVARVYAATGMAPVLICHSMGGLAARAWLRASQGDARVAHIVNIAVPHRGTWTAQWSALRNGQQMRVGSDWLRQLAQDEPAARAALFTCWYSNCDNVVLPSASATLAGARNLMLAGQAHIELAFHPLLMQATLSSLRQDQWRNEHPLS